MGNTLTRSNSPAYYIGKPSSCAALCGKPILIFLDKVVGCPACRITNTQCGTIAATSVSSLSDSLPVQCTDGSVPEAPSTLDSTSSSMQPRYAWPLGGTGERGSKDPIQCGISLVKENHGRSRQD